MYKYLISYDLHLVVFFVDLLLDLVFEGKAVDGKIMRWPNMVRGRRQ